VLKQDFVPYLSLILPQVLQIASLNPEMGIEGLPNATEGLVDLMNELGN